MNDAEEIDSHSPEEDSVLGDPEEDNDSDQDNHMELNLDLIGKDETQWQSLSISHVQRRLLQQWNIVNFTPGPTSFASRRIIESSPFSSFRVSFVKQCSELYAHLQWLKHISFLVEQIVM